MTAQTPRAHVDTLTRAIIRSVNLVVTSGLRTHSYLHGDALHARNLDVGLVDKLVVVSLPQADINRRSEAD